MGPAARGGCTVAPAQALTLLTYRFVQFKRIGHHYYLLDLCYVVNALLCLYCGLALAGWGHLPFAMTLFQALFAMTNGPLAWAIPLFNNKLKFHSAQHMISLFIHISPACTTYAIRWYLDRSTFPLASAVADPQVRPPPPLHTDTEPPASPTACTGWVLFTFRQS